MDRIEDKDTAPFSTMERWVSAENRLEEKSDEAFARVIGFDRDGEDGFRLVLSCKKLLKQARERGEA